MSILTSLSARRDEALERVRRLRRIQSALAPLALDGQDENALQQNLVTRDGQLEQELDKMRMLLVRVGGRVAALPDVPVNEVGTEDTAMVEHPADAQSRKADAIMDLF